MKESVAAVRDPKPLEPTLDGLMAEADLDEQDERNMVSEEKELVNRSFPSSRISSSALSLAL